MSEDRDAKLREIARELHGDPCPHPEQPEQGMNECLDCILSALSAARAEGERAGRGAERERAVKLIAIVRRDLVRALESGGERLSTSDMIAACDTWAARARGSE